VAIGRAHCCLEHQVQAIEPYRPRHLDLAHNYWFDVVKCDLEMGNAVGGHAARLRRFISRAQFQGNNSSSLDAG
jgi:hypothetical protein